MIPELKDFYSTEVEDLENYQPEDPEKFSFDLAILVGPKGEEGAEKFEMEVCTFKWLEETCGEDEVAMSRHRLMVHYYNYKRIIDFIEHYLRTRCSGENWHEVGEKVSRLGYWEFEDYVE